MFPNRTFPTPTGGEPKAQYGSRTKAGTAKHTTAERPDAATGYFHFRLRNKIFRSRQSLRYRPCIGPQLRGTGENSSEQAGIQDRRHMNVCNRRGRNGFGYALYDGHILPSYDRISGIGPSGFFRANTPSVFRRSRTQGRRRRHRPVPNDKTVPRRRETVLSSI